MNNKSPVSLVALIIMLGVILIGGGIWYVSSKHSNTHFIVGGGCKYRSYSGICTVTSVSMSTDDISFKFSPSVEPMNLKGTWADISGETVLLSRGFQHPLSYLGLACLKENKCKVTAGSVFNCNLDLITNGACSPETFKFLDLATPK